MNQKYPKEKQPLVRSEKSQCKFGNKSYAVAPFLLINVQLGDHSYIARNAQAANVSIGKFCSIGPNFCCGLGIHPLDGFSTSPYLYPNGAEEHKPVFIGNDVFIGACAGLFRCDFAITEQVVDQRVVLGFVKDDCVGGGFTGADVVYAAVADVSYCGAVAMEFEHGHGGAHAASGERVASVEGVESGLDSVDDNEHRAVALGVGAVGVDIPTDSVAYLSAGHFAGGVAAHTVAKHE